METMNNVKRILSQIGICIGLLIIIWGGYFIGAKKINQRIEDVLEDDFSWIVQVDEVRTEGNKFVLEGFAFKLNQDAENEAFDIVLHNLDTDKYLFPKMEYEERNDVNNYFLCEYDYTKSGFTARIKEKKLDLDGNDYEVLLKPRNDKNPYQFATYVGKGELMHANPKAYEPLGVAETDLEEVVNDGTLRVYRPDIGMYVYQFNDELYWIAEADYVSTEMKSKKMVLHWSTTQYEKLPKESIQYRFRNEDYNFEREMTKEGESGEYCVVCKSIPKEYSITRINTGNYENGIYLWRQQFRPRYLFD